MGDQLEVTVLPVAGCFFAGESFTVHITLSNRLKPSTKHAPMSSLHLHGSKGGHRSAVSLSLSNPSSPAASNSYTPRHSSDLDLNRPRTPLLASFAALPKNMQDQTPLPTRKGIVGKNAHILAAAASRNNNNMPSREPQPQLYDSKRLPSQAQHKKHNYSMAWSSSSSDLTDLSAQHAAASHFHQQPATLDEDKFRDSADLSSRLDHHPSPNVNILWAFAQLQGCFEVDDTLIKPDEFNAVKRSLFAESKLVGGGSLDAPPQDDSGWREWLWWSSSASGNNTVDVTAADGQAAAPSVSGAVQGGWTLADRRSRALADRTVPTLSIPPSVFATDLSLAPGESRTFAYTLKLPGDLPPSHRGRSVNFRYSLVVGTNRDSVTHHHERKCRLMHIPVRIYNNVNESGARPFYDMTNPIVWLKDQAETSEVSQTSTAPRNVQNSLPASSSSGKNDVHAYLSKLLGSIQHHPPSTAADEAASNAAVDSLGAIEMISRTSTKSSFDINKDGRKVASVIFAKSAFRLGETMQGAVALNFGEAQVHRVSARLETYEQVETTISMKKAGQIRQATRKLHAEQHEIVADAGRIAINLSIPSGATPEFATSGVRLQWCVRFSFLVSSPPPPTHASPARGSSSPMMPGSPHLSQSRGKEQPSFKPAHHSKRSSILGSLVASAEDIEVAAFGPTETIECPIPIKVYPASTPFRPTPSAFRESCNLDSSRAAPVLLVKKSGGDL